MQWGCWGRRRRGQLTAFEACIPLPTLCTGPVVPTQRGGVLSCHVGEETGHRGQCLIHGHREGVEVPGCKASLSPQATLRSEDLTDQAKVVVVGVCFSVGEGTAAGGQLGGGCWSSAGSTVRNPSEMHVASSSQSC